jgi:hypothetical protein
VPPSAEEFMGNSRISALKNRREEYQQMSVLQLMIVVALILLLM